MATQCSQKFAMSSDSLQDVQALPCNDESMLCPPENPLVDAVTASDLEQA